MLFVILYLSLIISCNDKNFKIDPIKQKVDYKYALNSGNENQSRPISDKEAVVDKGLKKQKDNDKKDISIDFAADVLSANIEKKNKKKLKTYNYTILCNLNNQGKVIKEGDLSIGTILYVRGRTNQKREKKIPLRELATANINQPKLSKIIFPITKKNGHRIFKLDIPNVPKSDHRVAVHISLWYKDSAKPLYTKLLTLHNPGDEDDVTFFSKANDKKWWWLTSGLALSSLTLGGVAIALALA